jgi:hypothetical protein
MPSGIVTKDDVQDTLYLLGIKDPKAMATAIRAIDWYSVALARRATAPLMAYPRLQPGKSDLDGKITCCVTCEKVKAWSLFPYDLKSDTKHSDRCKDCSATSHVGRDPHLELECSSCGLTKNADIEFRRSASSTGYRGKCKKCEQGTQRCPGPCGRLRSPREYVKGNAICVFCLAAEYVKEKNDLRAVQAAKAHRVPRNSKGKVLV